MFIQNVCMCVDVRLVTSRWQTYSCQWHIWVHCRQAALVPLTFSLLVATSTLWLYFIMEKYATVFSL